MLASKHFKTVRGATDDWFDPILNADTELFVDPFLIFKDTNEFWRGAHDRIIGHFNRAFQLIAEGNRDPKTLSYTKALDLLIFTEPKELCLGYTSKGTAGLGSGREYARRIAAAIVGAIVRGIAHPRHFEELGILNEGIGSDRISDATCTILKYKLVEYTQEIANRHGIPLAEHRLYAARFDEQRQRWETPVVTLPSNPHTGGPLLLVPERFLRDLPTLNADDWWTYYENEQLRTDLNYEILRHVDKATIVAKARAHPDLVRKWTLDREGKAAAPYDLAKDPKGAWQWDQATQQFASTNPLQLPPAQSAKDFAEVIALVVRQFRLFVEEQGGWELLWDSSGKDKPEHAAQLLFRGIAQHYCKANNISLDPEVNLGRGPVDFKFSSGYSHRAHLEIKKLHNGRFWNGLEAQLPSYMKSDEVSDGWFIAVRYRSNKSAQNRVKELARRVAKLATAKHLSLRYGVIDARPKESASKL
jgi:hypothetical protein